MKNWDLDKLLNTDEVSPAKPKSLVSSEPLSDAFFVQQYLTVHHCKCICGSIWDEREGWRTDESIKQEIQREIGSRVQKGLAKRAQELLTALKTEAYCEPPEPDGNKVHFQNGFFDIRDGSFCNNREFSYCVIPHDLDLKECPTPKFTQYLNDLLEPEDVETLQEFTGYCMIPSNRADIMLYVVGPGEEGKTVFGTILTKMFGKSMATGSLHSLAKPFGVAALENKLLFLDDDLSTKGFKETSTLKKVITCRDKIQYEHKGRDAYNGYCFCKLLALGNGVPTDLYDHTHGAERRKVIITTKPKPEGRAKNSNLAQEIIDEEMSGVIQWALEGLKRLYKNNWKLTQSERTRRNLEKFKDDYAPAAFLKDTDVVRVGNINDQVTRTQLKSAFIGWCSRNGYEMKSTAIYSYLNDNGARLNIREKPRVSTKVDPTRSRGYEGIALMGS